MFLDKLKSDNPALFQYAFDAHQSGEILPDTYILDLDTILENGKGMLEVAKKHHVRLYFMLKQIGRNPLIAKELIRIGFPGCVAVDYKEALLMIENGVHLGNVGHLVQTPEHAMKKIISAEPDFITVYSREKIKVIDRYAQECGRVQPVLIRISDDDAELYSGQEGGFSSGEARSLLRELSGYSHVSFGGFTTFPALLYQESAKEIRPTSNMRGLDRAVKLARQEGYEDFILNVPSATCQASIPLIQSLGGNNAEPGHGLTGTTPLHKQQEQPEKTGYVYVSEVSHNYRGHAYCYGGGYYRRGHAAHACVGVSAKEYGDARVKPPLDESIDYYLELEKEFPVSSTVLMCFRTQIFTTRSDVVVVRGLQTGTPVIVGRFTAQGKETGKNW